MTQSEHRILASPNHSCGACSLCWLRQTAGCSLSSPTTQAQHTFVLHHAVAAVGLVRACVSRALDPLRSPRLLPGAVANVMYRGDSVPLLYGPPLASAECMSFCEHVLKVAARALAAPRSGSPCLHHGSAWSACLVDTSGFPCSIHACGGRCGRCRF